MNAHFSKCQMTRRISARLVLASFYCAEIHTHSATDTQIVYFCPKIFFCEYKYLADLPKRQVLSATQAATGFLRGLRSGLEGVSL